MDSSQQSYILDLIETVEGWDNAMHRNFSIDKRESLMVKQSRELRDERNAFLFKYLMENSSAIVAFKNYSNHVPSESPRYNRAALVSALELIHYFDLSIKEHKENPEILELHQKQRNNQWFFIFDYLCELGGKNLFPNSAKNYEHAMAAWFPFLSLIYSIKNFNGKV